MPKVSILVPVYNVERYLDQCMQSLICQSLEDMEIICVNDGSTDHSLAILRKYEEQDPRVHIIDKKNTGYGHSMNTGLAYAAGEYIGIVESDDYAGREMFQSLYQKGREYSADMVKADFYRLTDGKLQKENSLSGLPEKIEMQTEYRKRVIEATPSIWSGIYKRSFLEENQIQFHESPGASYQDAAFSALTTICAGQVILLQEAYLCYRCDNMESSVKDFSKVFTICDEFRFLEEQLYRRGFVSQDVKFLFTHLKYLRYRWNYFRLLDIDKKEFIHRMADEFTEHERKGELAGWYWTESEWKELQQILSCPEQYVRERRNQRQELYAPPVKNYDIYAAAVLENMFRAPEIILYGCGKIGQKLHCWLTKRGYCGKIIFASTVETPQSAGIEKLAEDYQDCLVAVAVTEEKQGPMIQLLKRMNFRNVVRMDAILLKKIEQGDDWNGCSDGIAVTVPGA